MVFIVLVAINDLVNNSLMLRYYFVFIFTITIIIKTIHHNISYVIFQFLRIKKYYCFWYFVNVIYFVESKAYIVIVLFYLIF